MPTTPVDDLFAAIRSGDLDATEAALARGANPDGIRAYSTAVDRQVHEGTRSALMLAVELRHGALVRALLAAGANPDLEDDLTKRTPLVEASSLGELAIVEALLASGANVQARDALDNRNALTAAITAGSLPIAKRLAEAGAPPEPRALVEATRLGRPDLAEIAIAAGLDPNATDAFGMAATSGRVDMLHWLATRGVDVGANGPGALRAAANAGMPEAAKALIALGVPVETRGSDGWTAMHSAAYNGDAETLRVLLDAGADPRAADRSGKTPLDWAREVGKAENVALLEAVTQPSSK